MIPNIQSKIFYPLVDSPSARKGNKKNLKKELEESLNKIYSKKSDKADYSFTRYYFTFLKTEIAVPDSYEDDKKKFEKAGFTPIASELVKPFRVKESPVQLECKVNEVIALGDQGGAGNLIVCEILLVHIQESILDGQGRIDQHKIDLVARLGGDWYSRNSGNALFEVPKPLSTLGIGVDAIPANIRNSNILSGNDLGKLGNVEQIPSENDIATYIQSPEFILVSQEFKFKQNGENAKQEAAKYFLNKNDSSTAWKILLSETI